MFSENREKSICSCEKFTEMDIKHVDFLYHWHKVKEHAHIDHWNK